MPGVESDSSGFHLQVFSAISWFNLLVELVSPKAVHVKGVYIVHIDYQGIFVLTWNLFVLYLIGSTFEKKTLSKQNKGLPCAGI